MTIKTALGIEIKDLSYHYDPKLPPALKNISLSVKPGEIVLVTGASGSGKTTLMRCINGLCPHVFKGQLSGRVIVDGLSVPHSPLMALSQRVGTLFQDPEDQFFALSVDDELAFALKAQGIPLDEIQKRVDYAKKALNLPKDKNPSISTLSEGQKQKVGLAELLALSPRVIVLDEPTANLDPESTRELAELLLSLKQKGFTILVVDHRLYWLKNIADRVALIDKSEMAYYGPFSGLDSSIRRERGLREIDFPDFREKIPEVQSESQNPNALVISHLCFQAGEKKPSFFSRFLKKKKPTTPPYFKDLNLALNPGITVFVGKNGTGKTTLARVITGLEYASAQVKLAGQPMNLEDVLCVSSVVLQNTDHQLQMQTVFSEVEGALMAADWVKRQHAFLSDQSPALNAQTLLEDLDLWRLKDRHPQSLSGGEKQRLVVACALAKNPKVLIFDEPTSGLDGQNMQRMATLLKAQAQLGRIVILITNDLELMQIADAQVKLEHARA